MYVYITFIAELTWIYNQIKPMKIQFVIILQVTEY